MKKYSIFFILFILGCNNNSTFDEKYFDTIMYKTYKHGVECGALVSKYKEQPVEYCLSKIEHLFDKDVVNKINKEGE